MYCQQLPIVINHDWEKTKTAMKKLMSLKEHAVTEPYGDSNHYLLKSLGTISDHRLSKSWFRISGEGVNKTMPWVEELRNAFADVKINDIAVSYLVGDAGAHVDWAHQPSALNYIFENSDDSAYTWIDDGVVRETHPSTVNTGWIIDTQQQHGVVNSGERWSLSIHFDVDYKTLKQWADKQPTLIFGNK